MKNQKGLTANCFAARRMQAGQTLLEVLLALSVAVFILSAITVIVINSLNNATFTKNQNLATQYAQEGIEVVRRKRDSSWTNFSVIPETHQCLPQSKILEPIFPPNCKDEGDIGTIFIRAIDIDHDNSADCPDSSGAPPPPPPHGSKVTATVLWSDGKCPVGTPFCHNVQVVSCFYDINSKPPP